MTRYSGTGRRLFSNQWWRNFQKGVAMARGVALAPAGLEDSADILGVQDDVHGAVDAVGVGYLAAKLPGAVPKAVPVVPAHWLVPLGGNCAQGLEVPLEEGGGDAEVLRVGLGLSLQHVAEAEEGRGGRLLIGLPLGGDALDGGVWSLALGQVVEPAAVGVEEGRCKGS